jgi:hypothetical protein
LPVILLSCFGDNRLIAARVQRLAMADIQGYLPKLEPIEKL